MPVHDLNLFDAISQYCNNFEDFLGFFQVFYAIFRDFLVFWDSGI
jgi:hypothetical protein